VECVSWRFHEAVTRNHRCQSIEELIAVATDWLTMEGAGRPPIETYNLAAWRSDVRRELFSPIGRRAVLRAHAERNGA
jgi:hypothetical protein